MHYLTEGTWGILRPVEEYFQGLNSFIEGHSEEVMKLIDKKEHLKNVQENLELVRKISNFDRRKFYHLSEAYWEIKNQINQHTFRNIEYDVLGAFNKGNFNFPLLKENLTTKYFSQRIILWDFFNVENYFGEMSSIDTQDPLETFKDKARKYEAYEFLAVFNKTLNK